MTEEVQTALVLDESFEPRHAAKQEAFQGKLDEALLLCQTLYNEDKQAEATKKKLLPWLIVLGIAALLGFVFILPLLLLIPFFILLAKYLKAGKADLEDRKLDVANQLLMTFREEIATEAPVVLDLDFAGFDRNQGSSEAFDQQWLRMGLVLTNGGAVQVTARSVVKRKSKHKRKYTRRTDKISERLTVDIKPAKGQTLDPSRADRLTHLLSTVHPSVSRARVRLRPKDAQVVFTMNRAILTRPPRYGLPKLQNPSHLLTGSLVVELVTWAYRGVTGGSD